MVFRPAFSTISSNQRSGLLGIKLLTAGASVTSCPRTGQGHEFHPDTCVGSVQRFIDHRDDTQRTILRIGENFPDDLHSSLVYPHQQLWEGPTSLWLVETTLLVVLLRRRP